MFQNKASGIQEFGDAPGLGRTTAGRKGRIPIEDLADASQAMIGEVMQQRPQE